MTRPRAADDFAAPRARASAGRTEGTTASAAAVSHGERRDAESRPAASAARDPSETLPVKNLFLSDNHVENQIDPAFCTNSKLTQEDCMIETGINNILGTLRTDTPYNPLDPKIKAPRNASLTPSHA